MSFLDAVLIVVSVYAALVLIRVVIGPTIWDRLLGLNMISSKIIMSIIILSVVTDRSFLLDIALVYSFLGFIGTVLIARFVETRGEI
ncbi:monovalent cation/H+ antiporter complex subunit F [Alkalibacter saccharofermentans]|jgi:multicomponent Na+:H+ antiporter subunit F|uniref:Multisubunit sodium/proton antiporter, MrpF subunit (TC 2.A.63.1) n=1 Tax=Alkalibacter saccharofermentans DSM 14828 TaxID=1120975 RepID=A0A1M4YV45_9FIRM|nr:monovalent cation/H+ antiporter complex subunit F [Alkalibacter saccharofermentans]SHF09216.1 multisubunit sodium/proton antiporter, MrpF subunit (TC 2.A.63.1) [Alkalibacter saccharofermentans DSM 14828]